MQGFCNLLKFHFAIGQWILESVWCDEFYSMTQSTIAARTTDRDDITGCSRYQDHILV